MGGGRLAQQHRQVGGPWLDPGGAGSQRRVLSPPPVPPAASCVWAEMACSARSCMAWWAGRRGTPVWTRTSRGPRWYPAHSASASSPRVSRPMLGSVHWGRGLSTGRGWTLGSVYWGWGGWGSVHGGGAVHGGRGLSTGGGVDGVCSLGRGQASRCVHWAGPGVGSRPGHAGWSSGCVLGAGPAGRPCLPSGSLHFRRALLPTHLTRGHGCAGRGAVSSPGPRFPPRGGCGLCSQRAGRWWGVGSGGPEHSGGEGEPGEQAAAWKTGLVPGAGGWVSGRGPRGVRWLACPELAASACFMTGKSTSFSRRTHCSKGVGVRLGLCVHLTGRGRPPRPCLGRSSRDPGGSGSGVNGAVAPSSS